jgi:cytidylate kinase
LNEVAIALAERDRNDSTRADSPLMRAADAVLIETTGQPVEAVVDRVMEVVRLTAEKR